MPESRRVDAPYQPVVDLLGDFERSDPTYSAQVAVQVGGRTVVDAWAGPALGENSVICVFSVSKGLAGLVLARLIESGALDLDQTVAHYWPEFAVRGKAEITVGDALSHRAGLPFVEDTSISPLDTVATAEALAAAAPLWNPGAGFGYHALTVGAIADALVRQVTGSSLDTLWETQIRAPRDLEAWFRAPEEVFPRISPVVLPEMPTQPINPVPTLSDGVSASIIEWGGLDAIANMPTGWRADSPAAGAVASARGLAAAYGASLWDDGHGRLFSPETIRTMTRVRSDGLDLTTRMQLRFGALFMVPWPERAFAGWQAFGHDGAADSLAFADPGANLSFGYTTDRPYDGTTLRRPDALAQLALQIARSLH